MKKIFWLLCLVPCFGWGQVRDDFSDGNFSSDPTWHGDTARFEVNADKQLHLRSSGSDTSVLMVQGGMFPDTEWNFWLKLSFNTSANNFARVYLASESADPENGNSVFLQAGGSNDSVSVMRKQGNQVQTLYVFRRYATNHSTNTLRIRILCEKQGAWIALIDTTGGYNFLEDGKFNSGDDLPGGWTGLYCRYTSSNATRIWFDDFYAGPLIRDTIPPRITWQKGVSGDQFLIRFSETLLPEDAGNPEHYASRLRGNPVSAQEEPGKPGTVRIVFSEAIAEGVTDTVIVSQIRDVSGNRMEETTLLLFFYNPRSYDVLISEILADPEPPAGLPAGEFAELFNRTPFPLDLNGWTFEYGSSRRLLPEINLPPGGHLILCKDTGFSRYGTICPLFTATSSLSNEGTTMTLRNGSGQIIHTVTYSRDWYRGSFKDEGGWSLEMIDPDNPCGCSGNWGASVAPEGGTPGSRNSVHGKNPDDDPPYVTRVFTEDPSNLLVIFSEPMDSAGVQEKIHYLAEGEAMLPIKEVLHMPPRFDRVRLTLDTMILPGRYYTLRVSAGIRDCAGNPSDPERRVRFGVAGTVETHDVVINEILHDPVTGGARFVEIYNRSEKVVDLKTLALISADSAGPSATSAKPLTGEGFLCFPGDHFVLTNDPEDIKSRYRTPFPDMILNMEGFPSPGTESGYILLVRSSDLAVVDAVAYDAGMHYPLLISADGVSLERTHPDLSSGDRNNWHSAAQTAGYATPGYLNSHSMMSSGEGATVSTYPEIFSPDNDGVDDLLTIVVRETDPGYSLNIRIYDDRGRMVRQLANQVYTGHEGIFFWDGFDSARQKATIGIYILVAEMIWPEGRTKKIRKTTVLGGRLSD